MRSLPVWWSLTSSSGHSIYPDSQRLSARAETVNIHLTYSTNNLAKHVKSSCIIRHTTTCSSFCGSETVWQFLKTCFCSRVISEKKWHNISIVTFSSKKKKWDFWAFYYLESATWEVCWYLPVCLCKLNLISCINAQHNSLKVTTLEIWRMIKSSGMGQKF